MNILHTQGTDGEFYIKRSGEKVARLQYFHSRPGQINIYHTEVDGKLSGQGVGKQLVAAAVQYARSQSLSVVATCPFAKKVLDETPGFQSVRTAAKAG